MTLDVLVTEQIGAPPEAVAAVQFDPRRDPEWIGGVDRVEWLVGPPIAPDAQVRRIGRFLGRPIEWIMQVEGFQPGRHVAMRSLKAPFPMQVDYHLDPGPDGGTRASIRIRGAERGGYRMPDWLSRLVVKRSVAADLGRLRRIVEAGAAPGGGRAPGRPTDPAA